MGNTYQIQWETDFCEDFPEQSGISNIVANSKEEAISLFKKQRLFSLITEVRKI